MVVIVGDARSRRLQQGFDKPETQLMNARKRGLFNRSTALHIVGNRADEDVTLHPELSSSGRSGPWYSTDSYSTWGATGQ
jgi:hypothetical protein